MSTVPHHTHGFPHEPQETDDPRNALLDAFDAFLDALIDNGLEGPARARIAGHFPPLAASVSGPVPQTVSGSADAIETELELAALITDCARFEKLKMSAAAHAAIARMKARAKADLETIQHGVTGAPALPAGARNACREGEKS